MTSVFLASLKAGDEKTLCLCKINSNILYSTTTRAAATPSGSGALAVVYISGQNTFIIADKIFRSPAKWKKISSLAANAAPSGCIYNGDELIIDEVVITVTC
jgi:tRNA modification GTPase